MVHSSDIEYKETKLIKQGKASIDSKYKPLADWISKHYGANVLNVFYEIMSHNKQPRISVIFEFHDDCMKFKEDSNWWSNFDPKKQREIAEKYIELVEAPGTSKASDIFVSFSAFEPIAREEVNESISEERLSELKRQLNLPELWTISRCFDACVFFVYTDKQAEEIKGTPIHQRFADEYFKVLKTYDEFGYWQKEHFNVGIDSKENFDKNYESNWYYYYK